MKNRIQSILKKIIGLNNFEKTMINQNTEIIDKLNELEWAFIYRDSIRGRSYIQNKELNIGRWAGNYSFFYVLNRILHDVMPKRIFEVGLGESTKFISVCAHNIDQILEHVVIEHDSNWIEIQKKHFEAYNKTTIYQHDLEKSNFQNCEVINYQNLNRYYSLDFDFFVIDGPFGTDNFSRSQIVEFVKRFPKSKTFTILLDDTHRFGEKQTLSLIKETLTNNEIPYCEQNYKGNKTVSIITSCDLKFITSL